MPFLSSFLGGRVVNEIERVKFVVFFKRDFIRDVLPHPDGAEMTNIKPLDLGIVSFILYFVPARESFLSRPLL